MAIGWADAAFDHELGLFISYADLNKGIFWVKDSKEAERKGLKM